MLLVCVGTEFEKHDCKVEVSAVNMVTLKVEHSLVQCCTFPVQDFLGKSHTHTHTHT